MLKITSPYKNLGCLGFQLGRTYIDFFMQPNLGIFAAICTKKIRVGVTIKPHWVAAHLSVEHAFKRPTRFHWGRVIK